MLKNKRFKVSFGRVDKLDKCIEMRRMEVDGYIGYFRVNINIGKLIMISGKERVYFVKIK